MNPPVYLPSPINYPGSRPPTVASIPPGSWSGPKAPAISAPASTAATWASQPAAPRPIFRAKGPDESAPAAEARILGNAATIPLSMPTPAQLGIAPAPAADRVDLDWTAAQLERLGAIGFRFEKLETGRCRFVCLLPTRQPSLTHRVEAEAATEAEAVNLALAQAEKWTSTESRSK